MIKVYNKILGILNLVQEISMNLFLFLYFVFFAVFASAYQGTPPTPSELQYNQSKVVTYPEHGGRFGDQLLCYIHAKWISYYHGIPLLYRPFSYSDQLVLHEQEHSNLSIKSLFPVKFYSRSNINFNRPRKDLYIIPYFPESEWELTKGNTQWYHFSVDWKDKRFIEDLRRLIKPRSPLPLLALPDNRISIAVHVRKGGGFDNENTWKGYPMKFPPSSYYIEQLRKISELFPERSLYAHIFTDHANPSELIQEYEYHLSDLDIVFGSREKDNHHSLNVLEDFFQMMHFDCLIIADSNFSFIPSKLGNYKVVISPLGFKKIPQGIYIDKTNIEISNESVYEK